MGRHEDCRQQGGAVAVALGIGGALGSVAAVAAADTSDTNTSSHRVNAGPARDSQRLHS